MLKEVFFVKSGELEEKVKELLQVGDVTRIVGKDEKGNFVGEWALSLQKGGTLSPLQSAMLGAAEAQATHFTITIEKKE